MTAKRFASLDVFRGLTVFLMIVVNTPGAGAAPFAQLVHAGWTGLTLADLVYPSFLFAVGSALAFARLTARPAAAFLIAVGKRAATIFAIGVLMYWFPFTTPFAEARIPGVLQRIALCYLIAAPACRWLDQRQLVLLCAALLTAHTLALMLFGAPGQAFAKVGNAGSRLDEFLLGAQHLYRRDGGFDPEGLLGTLSASVNVIAGYLCARAILRQVPLTRLAAWGAALVVAGCLLALGIPIGKKLWTAPFVLVTTGIDLCVMALLAGYVEGRGEEGAQGYFVRFFAIYGRNPLAIYLVSELLAVALGLLPENPYGWAGVHVFQAVAPGPIGSLLAAIAFALLCWLVGLALHRRGLILKV
ncbi:MAG TPA: heparan-alpha-glucosaminide N-acetyltransferase domain-containing protein [Sphingomonas sp.]|nr:heparan-alpha-glucosaminide N-acetyltransferase domain-containing protein [Sphingomonas sp.]